MLKIADGLAGIAAAAATLPARDRFSAASDRRRHVTGELKGRAIAVLATDGAEQVELTEPVKALKDAGADVKVVSNKTSEIQGFRHHDHRLRPPFRQREKKLIAPICHGPWTLIDAGGVKEKTMTSWPSLKTDLSNAGAKWVGKQVATDVCLVTSRKPEDLPAFNKMMIEEFRCAGRR